MPRIDFGVEYCPLHGGLAYLRRRQEIFSKVRSFSGCVLDAGCGRGRYTSEIIKRGAEQYVGIDTDPKSLWKAKNSCGNNADFLLGLLENLPLKDSCVDFVFCSEVIEHVKDTIRVFREIFRVMKRRGVLLLSVLSLPLYSIFYLLLIEKIGRLSVIKFQSPNHLREYAICHFGNLIEALSSLENDLCRCGFKVVSRTPAWVISSPPINLLMNAVIYNPLNHPAMAQALIHLDIFFSRILRNFGSYTIIVCEKC